MCHGIQLMRHRRAFNSWNLYQITFTGLPVLTMLHQSSHQRLRPHSGEDIGKSWLLAQFVHVRPNALSFLLTSETSSADPYLAGAPMRLWPDCMDLQHMP